jgi:UDP-N-acetylglucosamine diphosphorylase/glucosamine-1-phosphate N-acetyltransferase
MHIMQKDKNIRAVVLAAGKGVRMKSDLPKVLHELAGRPLVLHVIENLKSAGVEDIVVVVGYRGELVEEAVRGKARVAWQREQLGTGHAVMQAESALRGFEGKVLIACGDVPLLGAGTFGELVKSADDERVKAVVVTMVQENPKGYGRIVKDEAGNLREIVEEKDASDEIRKIREVNTGTYVFDSRFLFEGLKTIGTDNAQGEYYLPDALQYIRKKGFIVRTLLLANAVEGTGINSKEELQNLEEALARRGING